MYVILHPQPLQVKVVMPRHLPSGSRALAPQTYQCFSAVMHCSTKCNRADTPGEVFARHIGLPASQTSLEVALPKVVLVIDFPILHLGRLFRL